MFTLRETYRTSLALLTDLYQLTMAFGYWKQGISEREAIFHLTFRRHPFDGQFTVACGLWPAIEFLQEMRFTDEDCHYLGSLRGADERPLFEPSFLDYLRQIAFRCDVDAIPEGTVAFAHEPLVRVSGPLLQAQLVETALLNIINYQTLIATKAARIVLAAQGDPVIEFGLRRAQGIDGGLAASRAAFVGGCAGTSNVLAGKLHNIPVKGTHAHSWVMAFDNESRAFQAYADVLPNNCVFLVDTYDTLRGVQNATVLGKNLRASGHRMLGIRLDSGDLGPLSQQSRKILNEAGLQDAIIVASNDLDEYAIAALKQQRAPIDAWGVGTKLVTAFDWPALGGVYKLTAIREQGVWKHRLKRSEEPIKTSTPGKLQVRRYQESDRFIADVIVDEFTATGLPTGATSLDGRESWNVPSGTSSELLVPVLRGGKLVAQPVTLVDSRQRTLQQLRQLGEEVTRLDQPRPYRVGLERGLFALKQRMAAAQGVAP